VVTEKTFLFFLLLVFALADVNDQLWVGGSFTAALPSLQPNETPVPAPGIAIWSGSNWTYPAGGFLASSSGSGNAILLIFYFLFKKTDR